MRDTLAGVVVPVWVDEPRVFETIRDVFREDGYLVDTHTAVALAASPRLHRLSEGPTGLPGIPTSPAW